MKTRLNIQIVVTIVIFVIMGVYSTGFAGNKIILKQPRKPIIQKTTPAAGQTIQNQDLADLIVGTMAWIDHVPSPGDKVGVGGALKFKIFNKGKKASEINSIKITCQSLSGTPCPNGVNSTLPCQKIYAKGSSDFLAWPPIVPSQTWKEGKYKLIIEVDYKKKVIESNESNNIAYKIFTVRSKTNPKSSKSQNQALNSPKAPATTALPKPDLIIQTIKMRPAKRVLNDWILFSITYRNVGNAKSGKMHSRYTFYRIGDDGTRHIIKGTNFFEPEKAIEPGAILEILISARLNADDGGVQDYSHPKKGDTIEAVFKIETTTVSPPESDTTNNTKTITFKLY